MHYNKNQWNDINVTAESTTFSPNGKVSETHAILHVAPCDDLFAEQLSRLMEGERRFLESHDAGAVIMKRYFVSDSANQTSLMSSITDSELHDSISIIQQPPLDGSKIAVWIYLAKGMEIAARHGSVVCSHNGYQHIWKMGMHDANGDSASQTTTLLNAYKDSLTHFRASIADNCLRTWFFVRDVDTQYAGMVRARRDFFTANGLSEHTHYIASTGIGGSPANTKSLVQLGAYAVTGFQPSQQRYLYALSHLNRTIEYGVTFERGTCMEYGDRAHAIISGTASIDNQGQVVHVGDIVNQTYRMWENVEKLLEEAGMDFGDVMQIIVYLRDTADYATVKRMFEQRFPTLPHVITLAPVCRPSWLIEMECIAVRERSNAQYKDF